MQNSANEIPCRAVSFIVNLILNARLKVYGENKSCNVQVVCRQCFVKTIQMAVAQKRLPLRCILCRAKILRIKQDHRSKDGTVVQSKDELVHSDALSGLPKSVSGYNINNHISSSGSNYSFTSGESCHIQTLSCGRQFIQMCHFNVQSLECLSFFLLISLFLCL